MQVANDVTSANELPSREARPGRRVNNSAAAGKLQGGELRPPWRAERPARLRPRQTLADSEACLGRLTR